MLNMIRMELYRMFKTKSLYVIWLVLAAGILFTTGLSADEMKTYTMEEKQEMYEYATGQQKSDTVNLGMDVTVPTKPGDTVSVFDLFYGNIKGKFLALFMVIFAVLYSTADMTSGFVKNIAGQVRDRRGLVFAKGVSLFVYTVLTMLIFTGIQTISNALFFDELVFGPVKEFLQYAGIQTLLYFALLIIVMCIAIVLRNNVISMMLSVCLCMNVLVIFYSFLDNLIAKAHIKNFHVLEYTVTGNISFLETNVTAKMAVTALAVSIAFVIVMIEVCSTVFKKRDI
ncbi:ABC transporter permease [Mediterraneibacter gnavus]|jgi:ABC-2 type transport system permease protein|uniref:ABC transporter permease n=1 Tax=Mediterraneibacter gnavus TaxID=33038 RepID=A0A412C8Y0_MEDGN|nr:ABC transporter permease [Mediterraneibacter gnavus]MCB5651956.1 ABC transporter permease [Mediterraneibacter gnavus]RGQ69987.1 ABC transporter permease [Mediterraneibacter gnavus]RGW27604.1 ABC transporter permease [Mediterraneibacter gnavus]RGZ34996.1 ABC transporter permease [Mediterraneibacter gnavus]